MTKKHFIALADAIRAHNARRIRGGSDYYHDFAGDQLDTIADFCASQNPRFDRQRWLDYIAGQCGPKGGKIKASQ